MTTRRLNAHYSATCLLALRLEPGQARSRCPAGGLWIRRHGGRHRWRGCSRGSGISGDPRHPRWIGGLRRARPGAPPRDTGRWAVTTAKDGAARWLAPLLPGIAGLGELDARRLVSFEDALGGLLSQFPAGPDIEPQVRGQHLVQIRRELAVHGQLALAVPARHGGCGGPPVIQALMQFVCGYHDADLRDSTGLGHGRLIALHASAPVYQWWLPRLLAGELAGIAITEPCGGSRVHAITTAATAHRDGTWTVTGSKTWISRLNEAAVFAVFFMDPAGRLTAGVIDAAAGGLGRRSVLPGGLSGWTWGELRLQDVELRPCDILGNPGEGMALLREHFAHYRPLVAATALGVAAAVHDMVAAQLRTRRAAGIISRLRDNALITLGRAYAQINAGLLAALAAQRLAESGDWRAAMWGCAIKAHAVDMAHAAASDLTLLAGAAGFTATSPLDKACRDLRALLYADGIHDSLYRATGRALTALHPAEAAAVHADPNLSEAGNRLHA
jgi:alkylation response protein AidB-like acyl-CoA dehydrogenase